MESNSNFFLLFLYNIIIIVALITLFMNEGVITLKSGKINDYLHLIDAKAYGVRRMLSIFLAEFDDCSILIDCGSSLDVKNGLRYFKKHQIPLSSFKYLITSHHHFDHNGGMWKLYLELKKYNPDVKILTNSTTKALLNDNVNHLNRGKRTYGNLVGEMKSIEEDSFKLIEPSTNFNPDPNKLDIIDTFTVNGTEIKLGILKTSGHTPDHQSPIFIKNGLIDFIFLGEAVGTLHHDSKLLTMPTSMPIYFNFLNYMLTLENLKNLYPLKAGFGHFGVVNGKTSVREILLEHETFMKKFRSLIISYYNEKPETKYIVEKIQPILMPRTDLSISEYPVFKSMTLAIVYGMMISCGFRSIPKEEMKYIN